MSVQTNNNSNDLKQKNTVSSTNINSSIVNHITNPVNVKCNKLRKTKGFNPKYDFPKFHHSNKIPDLFTDERDEAQIFCDMISEINNIISPETEDLWKNLCQRDILFEEQGFDYVPGLKIELRKEINKFKKNKRLTKNQQANLSMADKNIDKIQNPPIDNSLTSVCNSTQQLQYQDIQSHDIASLFDTLQNIPINGEIMPKCLRKYKRIYIKYQRLPLRKIRQLYRWANVNGTVRTRAMPVPTLAINLTNTNASLPYIMVNMQASDVQPSLKELPLHGWLVDTGSDSTIIPERLLRDYKITRSAIKPCEAMNIAGSTGIKRNALIGQITCNLHVMTLNRNWIQITHPILIAADHVGLSQPILGNDILKKSLLEITTSPDKASYLVAMYGLDFSGKYGQHRIYVSDTRNPFYFSKDKHMRGRCSMGQNTNTFSCVSDKIMPIHNMMYYDRNKQATEYNIELVSAPTISYYKIDLSNKSLAEVTTTYWPILNEHPYTVRISPNVKGTQIPQDHLLLAHTTIVNDPTNMDNTDLNAPVHEVPNPQNSCNTNLCNDVFCNCEYLGRVNNTPPIPILKNKVVKLNYCEFDRSEVVVEQQALTDYIHQTDSIPLKPIPELSHIPSESERDSYLTLCRKYNNVLATEKNSVGYFTGPHARLTVKPGARARQVNRMSRKEQEISVKNQIDALESAGVVGNSTGGWDDYAANLNLLPKPKIGELRSPSKADIYVDRVKKLNNPTILSSEQAYRVTVDYTSLNDVREDPVYCRLATLPEIQDRCRNSLVSVLDLTNAYYSIPLERSSMQLTNFYFRDRILMHKRLAQGLKSAPLIFSAAMRWTFDDNVLLEFLQKITSLRTHFHFQAMMTSPRII